MLTYYDVVDATNPNLTPAFDPRAKMKVNVIVTFSLKRSVLDALEGEVQLNFDILIDVFSTDTYDDVMRRLERSVFQTVKRDFGLNRTDATMISTCGHWRVWEELTGEDSGACDAKSTVAQNGKIYF